MSFLRNESLDDNETYENLNTTLSPILTTFRNNFSDDASILYPLSLVIPITAIYGVIFVTGVVGNVSTCIVIARNKSMHTATNYYLFSLAISDMLLLVSGLPPEMYRIWSPETYVFGEAFCVLQGFAAETSANATVLTITAFTVERYFAICHPFLSHTMSKLSRAVRYIIAIWITALCLAAPQAIQFGVEYEEKSGVIYSRCTVVTNFFHHAFEISTFLFFVGPMTLITVLYVLIGIQLRKSRNMAVPKRPSTCSGINNDTSGRMRNNAAQNRVVNMLIAVVAAFFICWAPFHAQRLLAVYLANASQEAQETTLTIYIILMHASGILYFLSTTINPVLYHIMSNKFREAFKKTLSDLCRSKRRRSSSRTYSVLSKCHPSVRNFQRSASDGVQQHINENLLLRNACNATNPNNFLEHRNGNTPPNCRPRQCSETDPNLILSTLSTTVQEPNGNCINNFKKFQHKTNLLNHKRHHPTPSNEKYLGVIRYKMLRLFHKPNNHFNNQFYRQSSMDSSNTISNSSLQDVDEIDYSSSDLVKYMEEINEDIA